VSVTYVAGPKNAARHRTRSVTYVAGHLSPMLPNETVTDVPACTLWFAPSARIADENERDVSRAVKRSQRANERILDEENRTRTTPRSECARSSSSEIEQNSTCADRRLAIVHRAARAAGRRLAIVSSRIEQRAR
jgi:hypothetical protein